MTEPHDRPDLENGAPHTYSAATRSQYPNHVYAALTKAIDFGPAIAYSRRHSGQPPRWVFRLARTMHRIRCRECYHREWSE